jgi:protein SCO1/2
VKYTHSKPSLALRVGMAVFVLTASSASAQPTMQGPDGTFSYDQRLNFQVPPDLEFRDESGRDVTLGDYFGKRPLVLVLAQYRCPMLCNQVLNGLNEALRGLPGKAGEQYDVLIVSFDAREKPELAAAKKAAYVEDYGRPGADGGFHFLTGDQPSIDVLTDTVGFRYAYSKATDRFAHPTGVVVLTPSGKVSRYFYGIEFPSADLGAALTAAASEQIGRPVPSYAQVLLLCYDYNPATGAYTLNVMNAVRLGGALTVILIVAGVVISLLRERRKKRLKGTSELAAGRDA